MTESTPTTSSKKLGILIGGSGLIGGTLMHYFKTKTDHEVDILAPNSKRLSLREPDDIRRYFEKIKPAFIINCAIASIDSDPQLSYEVNYLGTVYLAKAALELGIPYIHISSAAVLPLGENLTEEQRVDLTHDLPNYTKSKLMAELTLEHLHQSKGLDYTTIRLAVVYGTHDHKIQGFHRLFFSIADQAMPVLLTNKEASHSYSNSQKLPFFIHHALEHRQEFSGQTYHFVDPHPVKLSELILTIKSYLELKVPKEIYIPYPLAKFGMSILSRLLRIFTRIGIDARMPAELLFMKSFYQTQTLSAAKLMASSFVDPKPEATIYTKLSTLIQYYLTRWEHLNLIGSFNRDFFDPKRRGEDFLYSPKRLLETTHRESDIPFLKECALGKATETRES
ncbi:MAG: NAD(P)-dependent oxidoreductase [Desulfobulbaceae bacterium]|nr:NAD(P)-dependent oxidoreductase [Desulfobulbaceae bacterium]HIJ78997.1 NAD(P)-dependent oxidoreductase [Deltaproteobacteria bacterium]